MATASESDLANAPGAAAGSVQYQGVTKVGAGDSWVTIKTLDFGDLPISIEKPTLHADFCITNPNSQIGYIEGVELSCNCSSLKLVLNDVVEEVSAADFPIPIAPGTSYRAIVGMRMPTHPGTQHGYLRIKTSDPSYRVIEIATRVTTHSVENIDPLVFNAGVVIPGQRFRCEWRVRKTGGGALSLQPATSEGPEVSCVATDASETSWLASVEPIVPKNASGEFFGAVEVILDLRQRLKLRYRGTVPAPYTPTISPRRFLYLGVVSSTQRALGVVRVDGSSPVEVISASIRGVDNRLVSATIQPQEDGGSRVVVASAIGLESNNYEGWVDVVAIDATGAEHERSIEFLLVVRDSSNGLAYR